MKKLTLLALTALITLTVLLFAPSFGLCADTTFFGTIDTSIASADNLQDAESDTGDKMDYMDTKLVLGVVNSFTDGLRGIAAFEAGSIIWGIEGEDYPVGRNTGGGPSGDGINVETKNIYIDFDMIGELNLKCGLMPFDIAGGIIAGDDAFGVSFTIDEEIYARINIVKVYQESLGTRYDYNVDDADRREDFFDLEISSELTDNSRLKGFFGYLVDRYNGPETQELDRDIYYIGTGITGKTPGSSTSIDFIYNTGKIQNSDVDFNTPVDIDVNGYIVEFSSVSELGNNELSFNLMYASGDDDGSADKFEGFIVPETSYRKDIAEILTRGELSDELEGDEDYDAYQFIPKFSNIYFIKAGWDYQITKKSSTSLAVIYAALPEEILIGAKKANEVGTEIDFKFSHKIYAADDPEKGLKLDFIGAVLFSGDVFDEYVVATDTIEKANTIYEIGAKLTYEF